MEVITANLLAIWILLIGMGIMVRGVSGSGAFVDSIVRAPFNFFSWIFRGVFTAVGDAIRSFASAVFGGIRQISADLHRYFYSRWPSFTVVVYLTAIISAGVWLHIHTQ